MVTEVNEFVTVVVCNSNYFSMSLLQQYIYSYPFIYRPVNFKMVFVSRKKCNIFVCNTYVIV
jgi:hypothetical protein